MNSRPGFLSICTSPFPVPVLQGLSQALSPESWWLSCECGDFSSQTGGSGGPLPPAVVSRQVESGPRTHSWLSVLTKHRCFFPHLDWLHNSRCGQQHFGSGPTQEVPTPGLDKFGSICCQSHSVGALPQGQTSGRLLTKASWDFVCCFIDLSS